MTVEDGSVRTWCRPPALRSGDRVRVIAPATPVDRAELEAGVAGLRGLGLEVEVAPHVYDQWGLFAGRDEDRAADLVEAWLDPQIRAVVAAKGGYGCMRLLPLLPWRQLQSVPAKVLVGFSDVTALHLAFARQLQVVTFHGPMPSVDPRQGWPAAQLAGWAEVLFGHSVASGARRVELQPSAGQVGPWSDHRWLWCNPDGMPPPAYLRLPEGGWPAVGGQVTGRLFGGNLSLLAALTGTPFAETFEREPFVLFIEDVDEAPYRIDRMLTQLELAGVLGRAVGVVVGDFTNCEPKPEPVPGAPTPSWQEVVRERMSRLDKPVLLGVAAGHGEARPTFPLGVHVRLDPDGFWFLESGTSQPQR